jgi:hypothetical protein
MVIALLLAGVYFYHYLPDDTFITLRYAKNFLEGKGFVFNEGERVEGYTNFLWLLIITLAGKLRFPLILSARTLSCVFSVGTLILSAVAANDLLAPDRRKGWKAALITAIPPMTLASSALFCTWCLAGNEIPLFGFILLAGYILLGREKHPAIVFSLFAVLGLVRPEGLLFYALAGCALLAQRGRSKAAVVLQGALILTAVYAPYLIWKWHYFGSILPNTFYAKTGPPGLIAANGARYLGGFSVRYGYFLIPGILLYGRRLAGDRRAILLLLFIAVHWAELVFLGGDWMPNYRLLAPTMPLILVFVSGSLARAEEATTTGPARRNLAPMVALSLVFLAMTPGGLSYDGFKLERLTVRAFARVGQRLHEILPRDTRIACGSTGAIGFYSDMPIIDILGLTEPQIARSGKIVSRQPGHMKTDGRHVLSRKPDILLLGNIQIHRGKRGPEQMPIKPQERDIIEQPGFHRDHEFANIPLENGFYLSCYKRRSFFLPVE